MRTTMSTRGLQSSVLRKVMHIMEGLSQTQSGRMVYAHIEQLLFEYESSQIEAEQAVCGLLRMMLDAFSMHLPAESPLVAQIKLLQLRLTPPLSPVEVSIIQQNLEDCADCITRLENVQQKDIQKAVDSLLQSFGLTERLPQSESNSQQLTYADMPEGNVHYLQKVLSSKHSDRDEQQVVETNPENMSPRKRMESKIDEEDFYKTIKQSKAFGTLLEAELGALKQTDNLDAIEAKKLHLITEIERILDGHRQFTQHFDQVAHYLSMIQSDSDRLNQELERVTVLSLTDDLTNLPNRRAFCQRLEEEVSRAQRYNHKLSLALLDLDAFKSINDKYGHNTGDAVLSAYASTVLTTFRQHDLVARYGGEEFAVIFPNTGSNGALQALKKVQKIASENAISYANEEISLPTFSAGLVVYEKGETTESLIERADDALYRAKGLGRNRIETVQLDSFLAH